MDDVLKPRAFCNSSDCTGTRAEISIVIPEATGPFCPRCGSALFWNNPGNEQTQADKRRSKIIPERIHCTDCGSPRASIRWQKCYDCRRSQLRRAKAASAKI